MDEGFKWGGEDVRMGEVPPIVARTIKKALLRTMPDQTECECGRLTRLRRSSKVYDLEPQGAPYTTYESFLLPPSSRCDIMYKCAGRGKKDAGYEAYSKYPEVTNFQKDGGITKLHK